MTERIEARKNTPARDSGDEHEHHPTVAPEYALTVRDGGGEGSYEVKVISSELYVSNQPFETTMTVRDGGDEHEDHPTVAPEYALIVNDGGDEGSYEVKVISSELYVSNQPFETTMTVRDGGDEHEDHPTVAPEYALIVNDGDDLLPVCASERAMIVRAKADGFGNYDLAPLSPEERALIRRAQQDEASWELQEQAIAALVEEPTVRCAAVAAGVGKTTLYRWLQDPDFKTRYLAARREAVSQGVGRLQRAMYQAVDALEGIAADPHAPAGARIAAARTIITQALKGIDQG